MHLCYIAVFNVFITIVYVFLFYLDTYFVSVIAIITSIYFIFNIYKVEIVFYLIFANE